VLYDKITHNLTMHQRLEIGLYVIFLLFSTLLIASRLFSVGPLVQRVVDVNEIRTGVNLDYIVSTVFQSKPPLFGVASDSGFFPGQSTLQLYENGKQLGPAHSLHDDICNAGGGRSHWGNGLGNGYMIFSTSDNTDPRRNGRTYSVRFIAVPGLLLFGLAIAVWLLCFVRLYWISDRCRPAAIGKLLAEIERTGRLLTYQEPGRHRMLSLSAAVRVFVLQTLMAKLAAAEARANCRRPAAHHSYPTAPSSGRMMRPHEE
jgi:hypothetical protein